MEEKWLLKPETLLKEGLYRIVRSIEQDDSGITYEAEQLPGLRRVYVREFFLRDRCGRFFSSSKMTITSGESTEDVNQLKGHFLQEGQMKKKRGEILDVFEENWTAYYIMKNLSGRVWQEPEMGKRKPLDSTDPVRKEPETKPLVEDASRLPEEKKPKEKQTKEKKAVNLKGILKLAQYGLMSVFSLGLLALLLFLVFRPDRSEKARDKDVYSEGTIAVEGQEDSPMLEVPTKSVTEREKQLYLDMVGSCRDSIEVWGAFRGTVPTDVLALLKEIKGQEKAFGTYSQGFDASSGLADDLIGKMKAARQSWEKAGDDQRSISTERSKACYQLALDLAEAIVTLRKEILEKEADDVRIQGDISRIRNKMEGLN